MILFPIAKINLGLHVTNKRPDGFHEIESCLYPIPLCDILEIIPAEEAKFIQTGIDLPNSNEKNICQKAYDLLAANYNIPPVFMHLRKQIPIGAGLGGGSSDAAFVLKGLNELFSLNISQLNLESFAAELGSDCPFFITSLPCLVGGRGEVLSPSNIDLSGKFLVLINPNIHISTKDAYALINPKQPEGKLEEILSSEQNKWKNSLVNDFQVPISKKYPIISETIDFLYENGAYYAAMSGSGSTVFGLFDFAPLAESRIKKVAQFIGEL
ncbi:MAG: 4-(cytidine 5'-diphospho)-2-C-methyl-D-erythritol kinase [Crocinitomicaceae bacterium]|nr:4-(cytidine 5'-diphospho)-2-C-methyl-D-erythritol kinase [Crocinitomicaceae bacterium]